MTTKRQKTSIYLDPHLLEWLRVESERRCCSVAQLIRLLVVDAMDSPTK